MQAQKPAYEAIGEKVAITYKTATASQLLKDLDEQTSYDLIFQEEELKKINLTGLQFSNTTLGKVLVYLEQKAGLVFSITNKTIAVKRTSSPAPASKKVPGKMTGKVTDEENGDPITGATVRVGTTGAVTDMAGMFTVTLPKGNYTAAISFTGYGTKELTDIDIQDDQSFELNVALKRQKGQLAQVVVSGSARKESVASLYTAQKNRASISDGISAEQIARTPDNNIGQVLKRISGVATVDNKFVIVRGMTERYNQAMIDAIILPSTDMNRRNFSFEVVPAELVSNVVVNKTAIADASSEFSGGQVNVNTLDMPSQNFTQITIGTGFNSNALGKTFLQGGGRGTMDIFGFDDGRRKQPENMQMWLNGNGVKPPDFAVPQSKRFRNEGLHMYDYKGQPNQNYRISLGRVFPLKDGLKFGLVAGLNLRNSQDASEIKTTRNSYLWSVDSTTHGYGNSYKYSSTLGALLNMALTGKKFRLSFKNLYTHTFHDDVFDLYAYDNDETHGMNRQLLVDPEQTSLLLSKLEGEFALGSRGMKLTWSGAMTTMHQQILDRRKMEYGDASLNGELVYLSPNVVTPASQETDPDYRLFTNLEEKDYNWALTLSQPFTFLKDQSVVKTGYMGWYKQRSLSSLQANMFSERFGGAIVTYDQLMSPANLGTGVGQAYYYLSADNGQQYAGESRYHSAFLMMDQRFFHKWRLVYGMRAENFELANSQQELLRRLERDPAANTWKDPLLTGEKNWRFLPSVNLTYNLTDKMNLRLAYSITMVRPDFRESAYFGLYDPSLQAGIHGWNVVSTKINNYDFRYEFYPSPGEIFSVSAFYKTFDKPLELVAWQMGDYRFQNQRNAINYGAEMEFRKHLGFIANKQWLKNITVFGNACLIGSKVNAIDFNFTRDTLFIVDLPGVKRPLYGQVPWAVNAGMGYDGSTYGINIMYNRTGYKPFTLDANPNYIEYENGRDLVDMQLYARLLKRRLEVKMNFTNLLNKPVLYYLNYNEYDVQQGIPVARVNGTDKFERDKGDVVRYITNPGRNVSLNVTYRF